MDGLLSFLKRDQIEKQVRHELLMSLKHLLDEAAEANASNPQVLAILDWLREAAGVPR